MSKYIWIGMVVAGLIVGLGETGCKKRPKAGSGMDGIDPVTGLPLYGPDGRPLGDRFGGTEYAGQFAPVYYAYDSAQVNPEERAKLEAVADHLRRNPGVRLIVEGHCDERGSREYNLALGERRALAARAYLIGLGIDSDRIQTKSYGSENPVALGHDEESWRQNRRAEFVISY